MRLFLVGSLLTTVVVASKNYLYPTVTIPETGIATESDASEARISTEIKQPVKLPDSDVDGSVSYSSESDSDNACGTELSSNYCPVLRSTDLSDCEKITQILVMTGIDRRALEFCDNPEAWLEQLKICCEDEKIEPEHVCLVNVTRILRERVGLIILPDLQ